MRPATLLVLFAATVTARQLNCCPVGYTFQCCESSVPNDPADEHRTGIDCKSLYLVISGSSKPRLTFRQAYKGRQRATVQRAEVTPIAV